MVVNLRGPHVLFLRAFKVQVIRVEFKTSDKQIRHTEESFSLHGRWPGRNLRASNFWLLHFWLIKELDILVNDLDTLSF